jgi:hypothetical protein
MKGMTMLTFHQDLAHAFAQQGAVHLSYQFDETPVSQVPAAPFAIAGFLLLAITALVIYVTFFPKKATAMPSAPADGPRHSVDSDARSWHGRVAAIAKAHRDGTIDDDEAYRALAKLSRDYASMRMVTSHVSTPQTGSDLSSSTLTDLRSAAWPTQCRDGAQALRQTIAALYPPEFANPASDSHAAAATVDQACDWVDSLIERWR